MTTAAIRDVGVGRPTDSLLYRETLLGNNRAGISIEGRR